VTNEPVGATLLDQPLVVYRAGEHVVVANDVCPHRGVPLSAGTGDGRSVACAYHGIRFGEGGACVSVPAHPAAKIPARLSLRTYPATERHGLIWTCLHPDPQHVADPSTAPIPPMPGWNESGYQRVACPAFDFAAFAGRQIEGFLDVAHFGFVHVDTFGDPDKAEVPDYTPVMTDTGFAVDYWSTVGNYPHGGNPNKRSSTSTCESSRRTAQSSRSRNRRISLSIPASKSTSQPTVARWPTGEGCAPSN
jgi:vanillate O-demethylase monooxygenase subunit